MLELPMDSSAQKVLFEKDSYYEDVTRMLRWFAIGVVFITFPLFASKSGVLVFGLICAAVIYNVLRYSSFLMSQRIFASKINMLIMDNFFVFGLLFLSGGLNSPYFFFLGFMIITAAYWYGLKGLAVMVVVDGLASLALLSTGPSSLQPTDIPRTLLIKLLTLAIIGVLAEPGGRGGAPAAYGPHKQLGRCCRCREQQGCHHTLQRSNA
jgi:hypothetical protein